MVQAVAEQSRIELSPDDVTRAYGTIHARGGAQGGNGGFAEVSGRHHLEFQAAVDLRAPRGDTGSLLLDPDFIDVALVGFDSAVGLAATMVGVGVAVAPPNSPLRVPMTKPSPSSATAASAGKTSQAFELFFAPPVGGAACPRNWGA